MNGDAGLDLVLDQIEALRARHPRAEPRIVLEHYGYAREDQHARVAALGVAVSNNAYYLHELAPIYAEHGLGPERAADISPLGGLARAGVPISFHSDFPMAPAEPLTLVWVAVNRIAQRRSRSGARTSGSPSIRALRAVTIEAARSLGLEDEIGSIDPASARTSRVLAPIRTRSRPKRCATSRSGAPCSTAGRIRFAEGDGPFVLTAPAVS